MTLRAQINFCLTQRICSIKGQEMTMRSMSELKQGTHALNQIRHKPAPRKMYRHSLPTSLGASFRSTQAQILNPRLKTPNIKRLL